MQKALYLAKVGPFYKIGCTRTPRRRMYALRYETALPVRLLAVRRDGGHCLEHKLHQRLRKYLAFGREWYEFTREQLGMAKRMLQTIQYV